eukprot:5852349-Amphidinium_carterae.1
MPTLLGRSLNVSSPLCPSRGCFFENSGFLQWRLHQTRIGRQQYLEPWMCMESRKASFQEVMGTSYANCSGILK